MLFLFFDFTPLYGHDLIRLDRYLNPKEKEIYPQWFEKQEERRAELAEEQRNREILSAAPSEQESAQVAESEPQQEAHYAYHLGDTVYMGVDEYEILSLNDEHVMLFDTQFPLLNKEMDRAEFDRRVRENPMNDHLKVKNLLPEEQEDETPDFDIGIGSPGNIVSTNKEDPVQSQPIGRIDYLHTDGTVRESIEYTSLYQFEKDVKEENYYGVPMGIVLYKDKDGNVIPHEFISGLDPPPQYIELIDSPYLQSHLETAKQVIDEYCYEEFDHGADFSDLKNIEVGYTTTEDEEHEIQARVNLVDYKIETLVDDKVIRSEQFSSLEDMIERSLQSLSFNDLVYLSDEELEMAEQTSAKQLTPEKAEPFTPAFSQPKRSRVQTFDLHPEIPLSKRHTFDLASHEVPQAGKKERFRRNMAAINVLKECEFDNRFATPEEQEILSQYVGWAVSPKHLTRTIPLGRTSLSSFTPPFLPMSMKAQGQAH